MAKDTDDVGENVKQGLGLLWKAARKAARDVKQEVTKATVSRTLGDAGREVARAATNVAEKVEAEIKKVLPKEPEYAEPDDERMKPPYEEPRDVRQSLPRDGEPAEKPKGPTRSDPGFRIAIDDDDDRKR
jgi:Sec-independent protein translocase protein TatA